MCFDISVGLSFSGENATVTYQLQFGVPEDDDFMKYMMSEELVLGILMQNFHDQNVPGCESLGLDLTSLLLYGKQYSKKIGVERTDSWTDCRKSKMVEHQLRALETVPMVTRLWLKRLYSSGDFFPGLSSLGFFCNLMFPFWGMNGLYLAHFQGCSFHLFRKWGQIETKQKEGRRS